MTDWHTITVDLAGPLPVSGPQHHDMILVVIDKLTKCYNLTHFMVQRDCNPHLKHTTAHSASTHMAP